MTDTPTPRPFAEFLRMHGRGRSHDELGESLHSLVGRVRDTGQLAHGVRQLQPGAQHRQIVGGQG